MIDPAGLRDQHDLLEVAVSQQAQHRVFKETESIMPGVAFASEQRGGCHARRTADDTVRRT
ncbi:hypothetical protein [Micromonospora saelicesensis]|uniref:hypothetical protein n=1 Tax=Micromonospora saelicesensis TaxID=285676 RepID=UPI000B8314B0|nr:hypothetical protein [Micromonospora saelicesensis]